MKTRLLVVVIALALEGCLAIPHLDQRSPQVSGQVVDSFTRDPVSDAKVEFIENPALAVFTSEKGEFTIMATRKPELFVPISSMVGEMNIGRRIDPRLRVTREGYVPLDVDASKYDNLELSRYAPDPKIPVSAQGPLILKPIALQRLQR